MAAIDALAWREDDDPTTATLLEMTGVTGHKDVRCRNREEHLVVRIGQPQLLTRGVE